MAAQPLVLDFTHAELKPNGKPEIDKLGRPPAKQGGRPARSMNPKQIRARARRKNRLTLEDLERLYKPIDEWDEEELARGRPRDSAGGFGGRPSAFLHREVHEKIVKQFQDVIRRDMNVQTVKGLAVIQQILESEETDFKGKPLVSASTKLDATKFLIEHLLGKPKSRVETDISVQLQGILGMAMVNPGQGDDQPQLAQGYIDAESWEAEDDDGD